MSKWETIGEWQVYRGESALATGNHGKYYVFAGNDAPKLKVHPTEDLKIAKHSDDVDYLGYYGKNKAQTMVDAVDRALRRRHTDSVMAIKLPEGKKFSPLWMFNYKTKGRLLLYDEGDAEGLAHELGHLAAGHLEDRDASSSLAEEKAAIPYELAILKREKRLTPAVESRIASSLGTYMKGPKATRYHRARRIVKGISQQDLPSCSLSTTDVRKTRRIPTIRRKSHA
jgi:hypothetical protein